MAARRVTVEHYVLLAAAEGRSTELESAMERFVNEIVGLDSVLEITAGANFNRDGLDRGWTHGLLVRLATPDALPEYREHDAHVRFVSVLNETCTDRFAVDFETGRRETR